MLAVKNLIMTFNLNAYNIKLIAFMLFFTVLLAPVLRAENYSEKIEKIEFKEFEITAAFISSWKVKKIREYAVIEVMVTDDFVSAHNIIEQLRKFINEPILVKHSYANDKISYEITIGRFNNTNEAEQYHNLLK